MVYGRILYNNIKEYTPKWFPTIPYSQTVKPTFGITSTMQADNPKSSQDGMLFQTPKEDGDYWVKFSNTDGLINTLCFSWCSVFGPHSTSPFSMSIKPTTNTALSKQPSPKNAPGRRNREKCRKLKKQMNDQYHRIQSYQQ